MTDPQPPAYDSRPATYEHSLRVGALMVRVLNEIAERAVQHDLSKTLDPEVSTFDRFRPRLADVRYGSDEYRGFLTDMAPALKHHYANNAHHPEHHSSGIDGMTFVDLIEMLADWKASTELTVDGDLRRSIAINAERFGISTQLQNVMVATAEHFGWITVDNPTPVPMAGTDPPGTPAWIEGA